MQAIYVLKMEILHFLSSKSAAYKREQLQIERLGVARLICKMEHENRLILKPFGFLSRDARIKERKKYGLRKARKASQYSKR